MSVRSDTLENEATLVPGEPDCPDTDIDPEVPSEEDEDVLIPNTGAMSDSIFLGLTNFDRDGVSTL